MDALSALAELQDTSLADVLLTAQNPEVAEDNAAEVDAKQLEALRAELEETKRQNQLFQAQIANTGGVLSQMNERIARAENYARSVSAQQQQQQRQPQRPSFPGLATDAEREAILADPDAAIAKMAQVAGWTSNLAAGDVRNDVAAALANQERQFQAALQPLYEQSRTLAENQALQMADARGIDARTMANEMNDIRRALQGTGQELNPNAMIVAFSGAHGGVTPLKSGLPMSTGTGDATTEAALTERIVDRGQRELLRRQLGPTLPADAFSEDRVKYFQTHGTIAGYVPKRRAAGGAR